MAKTLKIEESTARRLYKTADNEFKALLEENFGKEFFNRKITDEISNIYDVLGRLGKTYDEVVPWKNPKNKAQKSQNALALIQCITEVYNEGTVLDFNDRNQPKYYLWFEKKAHGWVVDGCAYDYCLAYVGFGCYFKSEALAKDAGDKFLSIFQDYLP